MGAESVDVVVLDLGGALAGFGGVSAMQRLAAIDDEGELWHRWLTCRWVRDFERGRCTPAAFAEGVVADWGLTVPPDAFLAELTGWVAGPYAGAEALVAEVRDHLPVACLSNTNAVHWDVGGVAAWPLLALFDRCFLSFRLGMLKPDVEIYEHVCHEFDVLPERVLFLDDNALNVDAAASIGMRAVQAKGVDAARQVLIEAGVHLRQRADPENAG